MTDNHPPTDCPNCATLRELVEQWQRFHDHVMACGECLTIFVSGGVLCSKGCELWNAAAPAVPATPTPPTDAVTDYERAPQCESCGTRFHIVPDGGVFCTDCWRASGGDKAPTNAATCPECGGSKRVETIIEGQFCDTDKPGEVRPVYLHARYPCPNPMHQRKEGESDG